MAVSRRFHVLEETFAPVATSASAEIETRVGRGTALALSAVFVLVLFAVPVVDLIGWWSSEGTRLRNEARQAWQTGVTFPVHRAQREERNGLVDLERAIEASSWLKRAVQPEMQGLLSAALRVGNRKVAIGPDGWLFYRPGIDYVAGRGFAAASPARPAPQEAIRSLHRACVAAGVRLVVVPIPDKAMIHPEHLVGREWDGSTPDNPEYDRLVRDLPEVEFFRPLDVLRDIARTGPAFLRQDTHWTPEAMEAVAGALAAHLERGSPGVRRRAARPYSRDRAEVSRVGDLVDSLRLPQDQRLFAPEAAVVRPVRRADGEPWRAGDDAKVLLVGDSFTNIFTLKEMGWGEGAGLAPQLAFELGRAVDVVAVNAGGAGGSLRALAQRDDPLRGKRIVIWQFAIRDLATESWDVVPIRARRSSGRAANRVVLLAELLTRPPRIGEEDGPYENAVVFLKFRVRRVIEGAYASPDVLVQLPFMKQRKGLGPETYREGQLFRLELVDQVPKEWVGQRVVDETEDLELRPLWAAAVRPEG
jgi:alginate O-acetyltransferase complex protein AlgJ